MNRKIKLETTSMSLHVMAMLFMLFDHLWGTVVPGNDWMTCIGRLAFPIFAFMIVEGYFHTKNFRKYLMRILIFAVISEIPFNLVVGGRFFYPVHQNVLWSFLLSLLLIRWNESVKGRQLWYRFFVGVTTVLIAYAVGLLSFVDYLHAGILTVLMFYVFRERNWINLLCQIACMWYINVELLSGFAYQIELFGNTYFLLRQSLALLALIPIWLYRGNRGYHSKWFQYFCYGFYPMHLLAIGLIRFL